MQRMDLSRLSGTCSRWNLPQCALPHRSCPARFPIFCAGQIGAGREQPVGNLVMTLLVRRTHEDNADCPYAVQITFPREVSPGNITSLTSAHLIRKSGIRSTASETIESYRPADWRAADRSEQGEYQAHYHGDPKPWYCVMRSLCRSVFDFPGSGDRDNNNGQEWPGIESLGEEWNAEGRMRQRCEEELDAEWNKLFSRGETSRESGPETQQSAVQWAWRQLEFH
jgi:hypothetical protein